MQRSPGRETSVSVKILLLGDSGTGKTSLVLRYVHGPDAEETQAARCSVYDPDVLVKELVVDGKNVKVSRSRTGLVVRYTVWFVPLVPLCRDKLLSVYVSMCNL